MTQLPRHEASWRPQQLRGRRVLILGLGKFGGGLGAALYLDSVGAKVVVSDGQPAHRFAAESRILQPRGVQLFLGEQEQDALVPSVDCVVASPAVPWSAPALLEAARRGIPVETEISLLVRLLPGPWLGITGTNGKSTSAHLAHAMLSSSGNSWLGGNMGGSLLGQIDAIGATDAVVLELSSFQLEHLGECGLGPQVALLTNLRPDHLDRHGNFANYAAAKRSILGRARYALLPAEDELARGWAEDFRGRVCFFSGGDTGAEAHLDGDHAVWGRRRVRFGESALLGDHNRLNLLTAAVAVTQFGAPFEGAITLGQGVTPLSHRLQVLETQGGVRFVDDSVSTSAPAVVAALAACGDRIHLIAGGYDKGGELEELLESILSRCTKIYAYGAMAIRLAQELEQWNSACPIPPRQTDAPYLGCEVFPDLRAAFQAASQQAEVGDTVLLSPGFASYDQFSNFRERGRLFQSLVANHRPP